MNVQASQLLDLALRWSFLGPWVWPPHAQDLAPDAVSNFGLVVLHVAPAQSPTALLVTMKDTVSSSVMSILGSPRRSDMISGSAIPLTRLSLMISSLKSNSRVHPGSLHGATYWQRAAWPRRLATNVRMPVPGDWAELYEVDKGALVLKSKSLNCCQKIHFYHVSDITPEVTHYVCP